MERLIVKNIKGLRRFHRLTLDEFGDAIGFTKGLISRIESGQLDTSSKFVEAVCQHFHVKPNDIYTVDLAGALASTGGPGETNAGGGDQRATGGRKSG